MRMLLLVALALLSAALIALYAAEGAGAVGGATAYAIANGRAVDICPHHFGGVCMRRRVAVQGVGGGRWYFEAEGWERGWWEPWMTPYNARWYYKLCGYIHSNGPTFGERWC